MSILERSYIDTLIQEKKSVYLHLRNGGKITAIIVDQDDDNLFLSDAVATKISKSLVEMIERSV